MIAALSLLLPRAALSLSTIVLIYVSPASHKPLITRHDAMMASCKQDGSSTQSSHEQHDGQSVRWTARWRGRDCSVDLRSAGEVKFNASFTDVTSISDNGWFELSESEGRTTRKLVITQTGAGLSRRWTVDGRDQPWDDQGRRWLGDLLVDLDRMSAFAVDYRFPSLMANGGPRAVLDEIDHMTGDYARSVYTLRLVNTGRLSDGEYQRVVATTARDVRSDYETGRILKAVAQRASLDNDGMRKSYLDAVTHMTSDYERSNVLQTVFAKAGTSAEVARAAVRTAGSFTSDYERSRVLLAAIESRTLTGDDVVPVLETVTKSTSDYEKSRVMLAVAAKWSLTGDSRKAYLRAADTIRSDYENRRVLAALIRQEAR